MKLTYKGKYSGNEESLPVKEHPSGTVMFKEPDSKKFMLIANGIALGLTVLFLALAALPSFEIIKEHLKDGNVWLLALACVLPMVTLVPHELLHAVCFNDEVYMYAYPQAGAMFVLGLEDMSKAKFVFMSLLPNLILGAVPFIIGVCLPELYWLGVFGAFNIGAGAGDYLNVFNALTQVPKDAKIFASGFHSYWYLPSGRERI